MFANHAIRGLFGLAADVAVGRSIMSVVFTNEPQAQIAQKAIDAGERFVDEIDQADAHQGPAIEVTMARVNDSMLSEAATVAIARDITRRKATEAELDDYRRNLESLVEERSRALQREMNEHKQARGDLAESLEKKELLLKSTSPGQKQYAGHFKLALPTILQGAEIRALEHCSMRASSG